MFQDTLPTKLGRIYSAMRETMSSLIDTNNMYIALYDTSTHGIEFPKGYEDGVEVPDETKLPGHYLAPRKLGERKGLTDWVIDHRGTLFIPRNFQDWVHQHRHEIEAFDIGTQCWLGAPMLLRGEVIGVIAFQNFGKPDAFDLGHKALVETIARQAAVAIENVKLLYEIKYKAELHATERAYKDIADERKRRLEWLKQISEHMVRAPVDSAQVMKSILQAAIQVTQCDLASIYRYDANIPEFTEGLRMGRDGQVVKVTKEELPDLEGEVHRVAVLQEEKFVPDTSTQPQTDFVKRLGIKSYAGLPLIIIMRSQFRSTVGVLLINYLETPHPFSDEEKEILNHLATQAALALDYIEARASAVSNERLAALGTLVGALQHRLGNTIAIALPAAQRLRYRLDNDAVTEGIIETIERNTKYSLDIIKRMQDPLREERFQLIDVNTSLNDAILRCKEDAEHRFPGAKVLLSSNDAVDTNSHTGIVIRTDLQSNLPTTYAALGRITEVFRVLVENAIKAIHSENGNVTVKSCRTNSQHRTIIQVTVADTGKGIDPVIADRIFKELVPRKEFGQGAGMGLWLSHLIVRGHQGTIRFEPNQIGSGTTFIVRLPVLNEPIA